MTRLLRRLIHELGNGKAVANAAHDRRQDDQIAAAVDALGWRLLPAVDLVEEPIAA